jgi:signal transduction histidine kinase
MTHMRTTLTYVADSLIVLCCIAGFYQSFEKAGLPVVFREGSLLVEKFTEKTSSLQLNDSLVALDGIVLASMDDVEFLLDSKSVGQPVTLTIDRNGTRISEHETLVRFFSPRYLLIQLIVASLFIFLAIFVYTKRKEDRAARMFNWVNLCATLIIATTWGKFNIPPPWLGLGMRGVFNAAYACAGVCFVHFTLVFPSVEHMRTVKYVRPLYASAICLALASTYCFLQAARDMNMEWFRLYNSVFNATRLFLVGCTVAGLAIVIRTYMTAREESERRKLRWIILGLAIGPLCFITLWTIPQVLTSRGLVDEEYILLSMLSVPITFAISIVKYHLLNIDQVFKRGTVYAMVLVMILVIYALVITLSTVVVGTLTVTSSLGVSVGAAVFIAALFQPMRDWIQRFVDKRFFHVRYNYREAEKEFIDKIQFCYDNASIVDTVIGTIGTLIPNSGTHMFLLDEQHGSHDEVLTSLLRQHSAPLAVDEHIELGASYLTVGAAVFASTGGAIALRINSESNGLLGGLVLGSKRSGFRYNLEDIDLLNSICQQTALALDRIHLQRTLISAQIEKNKWKELNDLKSYFVSSVTHELKTPLTSIKMFTEMIEGTPKLPRKKCDEYLEIIRGETDRLTRLIDNVLNMTKIEKGLMDYHFATIDLNDCVTEALRTMQFQFKLHAFDCRTRLSKKALWFRGDKDAIIEVLINLITNSIKYSAHRKRILVSTRRSESGLALEVEDFGIGIADEELEKIFEPFGRSDSSIVRHTAGAGLGLALVRHITEAHNANVEVESELGKRTRFTITFPFSLTEEHHEENSRD